MPDDLIKKSIRLPADLDAYVDQQKGTTWTDKLCRILEDYRSGEETRAERMAYYENWIKASQKKIDEHPGADRADEPQRKGGVLQVSR